MGLFTAGGASILQSWVPPTVLQGSVGGTQRKRGTSYRFAGNLSEVLRLSGVQEVNVYEAVDFLDEFY